MWLFCYTHTIVATAVGAASIPVSVFVGTLVGVIAILICLIVIMLFAYIQKRSKTNHTEPDPLNDHCDYDYVSNGGIETTGVNSAIQMKDNEAYAMVVQDDNRVNNYSWSHFIDAHYEDIPC